MGADGRAPSAPSFPACSRVPFRHHALIEPVDEGQHFRYRAIQILRNFGLDVQPGKHRDEIPIFMDLHAMFLGNFDDALCDKSLALCRDAGSVVLSRLVMYRYGFLAHL